MPDKLLNCKLYRLFNPGEAYKGIAQGFTIVFEDQLARVIFENFMEEFLEKYQSERDLYKPLTLPDRTVTGYRKEPNA